MLSYIMYKYPLFFLLFYYSYTNKYYILYVFIYIYLLTNNEKNNNLRIINYKYNSIYNRVLGASTDPPSNG